MRKILHIDMDAFYASVEQRDNPALRGRPVVVGGDPDGRGVVAAASYEARRHGIHSAMAAATARRRCPRAAFIRPRFEVYRSVSGQIHDIFLSYTDLVEPLSLDEAYLDVTTNHADNPSATRIALEIKERILQETGLTASAGVSFNKFLAKVASDFNKPDGITVVTPEQAAAFIDRLDIRRFHGVGSATEKRMRALGIRTGSDLKRMDRQALMRHFGKAGAFFHAIAHCRDDRLVNPARVRKSLGKETTRPIDISDIPGMLPVLTELAEKVARLAAEKGLKGLTVTLKVKYSDFQCVTRCHTGDRPVADAAEILARARRLLEKTEAGRRKVRLLGITLSNFMEGRGSGAIHRQLPLPFFESDDNFESACAGLLQK